jgi:hypothetical protein
MANPALIDLALYLPAGGVNGFEINGHAVNGAGFVDSPFAGVIFELDPYRSIFEGDRRTADVGTILPSLLPDCGNTSYQGSDQVVSEVWAPRCSAETTATRVDSEVTAEVVSLAFEIEGVSVVPVEYNTAYVLASHPAITTSSRTDSELDALPPSAEPSEQDVSFVPAEDRTTKIRRI